MVNGDGGQVRVDRLRPVWEIVTRGPAAQAAAVRAARWTVPGEPAEPMARAGRVGRAAAELAAHLVSTGADGVAGFTPSAGARNSGVDVPAEVTPFSVLLGGHSGSRGLA